jgi:hypothetical protein
VGHGTSTATGGTRIDIWALIGARPLMVHDHRYGAADSFDPIYPPWLGIRTAGELIFHSGRTGLCELCQGCAGCFRHRFEEDGVLIPTGADDDTSASLAVMPIGFTQVIRGSGDAAWP